MNLLHEQFGKKRMRVNLYVRVQLAGEQVSNLGEHFIDLARPLQITIIPNVGLSIQIPHMDTYHPNMPRYKELLKNRKVLETGIFARPSCSC